MRPPPLLRTVRDSFPSYGSSPPKAAPGQGEPGREVIEPGSNTVRQTAPSHHVAWTLPNIRQVAGIGVSFDLSCYVRSRCYGLPSDTDGEWSRDLLPLRVCVRLCSMSLLHGLCDTHPQSPDFAAGLVPINGLPVLRLAGWGTSCSLSRRRHLLSIPRRFSRLSPKGAPAGRQLPLRAGRCRPSRQRPSARYSSHYRRTFASSGISPHTSNSLPCGSPAPS